MGLRADIKVANALKQLNGSTTTSANQYGRAIFHTGHNLFVMCGGNGVTYTLDGIGNKVQQTPGILAAALPNLVELIQDYRNGIQTLVGDGISVAIDDGSLDNWVIGGLGFNYDCFFTLAGDGDLYKIDEEIVSSNDNFVADVTVGATVFAFPGVHVMSQTKDGTRVVVASNAQVGFISAGQNPKIPANWNVIANVILTSTRTQIAVNDAGTIAIQGTQFGDLILWRVGVSAPTLYSAANNPFVDTNDTITNSGISSIIYSAFWGGFIIYNVAGTVAGFIDENNPDTVDSAVVLGFTLEGSQDNARKTPISAANPAGEIIICPNIVGSPHELLLVSPP